MSFTTPNRRRRNQGRLARAGLLAVASAFVLTACFMGALALVTESAPGVTVRLKGYVLAGAVAFVAAIFVLERQYADGFADDARAGRDVLVAAVGGAAATFVVATLFGEGVLYAARQPERVLGSEVLVYFLAAGLIATGLGYWGLRHWREFAPGSVV